MYERTTYDELRERVGRREPGAAVEMQHRLERNMIRLVRSLIRTRRAHEPLELQILEEVDRLPRLPRGCLPHEEEGMVRYVARRVATDLVEIMRRSGDTVPVYETLCA
jgi:hypothetical protein